MLTLFLYIWRRNLSFFIFRNGNKNRIIGFLEEWKIWKMVYFEINYTLNFLFAKINYEIEVFCLKIEKNIA